MASIKKFEDLEAWKLSREISRLIYSVSSNGAFAKDFALTNQVRRAAISIVSNIAEGFERNGDREFIQFLTIAKGSCGEVRAQLYVAFDQGYIEEDLFLSVQQRVEETSRIISGLIKYLKQSEFKGSKFN
jgi:four helix bundle protein